MRDEKQQIRRVHISPRKFHNYVKEHDIDPQKACEILPMDVLKTFETGPEKFPTGCMPLYNYYKCFICGKKTGWLDKFHGLFMCSEKCRDEIDARYNAGEDFKPHPKYVQICEDFAEEFEE